MQGLARISVLRPVFATVLVLALVVVGLFSVRNLGVDRFPNVDFPAVIVTTVVPGATPEEVETDVTEEIEKQVNTVSGIDVLRSTSSEGVSVVSIQFDLSKNGDVAAQEVRAKVDLALPNLPDIAERPVVQKFSAEDAPVLGFTLAAPGATLRDLTEYADKTLRPQIESISGVGEVQIVGGRERQINVLVDPYRLRAFDLTVADVANALRSQNLQVPGGSLEQGERRLSLRTQGRVASVEDLGRIVLRAAGGRIVRLDDVAEVEDAEEEAVSVANVNGAPAVVLNVRKQAGENTVAVIAAVKERLRTVSLPPGYRTEIFRDQSVFINASLHAVQEHLILGSFLAALVVLIFLWDWRSTLISSLAIPSSIIATFALMAVAGFTLNVITLLALTLAVGIVIDDAIIVLENIYRYIQEKNLPGREAAIQATREIGLAVLATTLSLIAVFAPVAFMSGIVGRFLNSFGLTMAFAILVSLLVAFTLTPMLASRWLSRRGNNAPALALAGNGVGGNGHREHSADHGDKHEGPLGAFFAGLEGVYAAVVRWSLGHRWVIVLASIGVFLSTVVIGKQVPGNFLPQDDESQFTVAVRAPEGTSLSGAEALLTRIGQDIRKLPEVRYTVVTIGNDAQQSQNAGEVYVRLNEVEDRKSDVTQFDLMARVRKEVLPRYPRDLRTQVAQVSAFGGGAQAGIQIILTGPDLDKLRAAADKVVAEGRKIPGVADIDTSSVVGRPEVGVVVDRTRAGDLGVSVSDVATSLRTLVAGDDVSEFAQGGYQYDINLRALPQYREREDTLSLFTVPRRAAGGEAANGEVASIPLSQVVRYSEGTGPSVIERYARQRQIGVNANFVPGASQQAIQNQLVQIFERQNLGSEYGYQFSGQSRELGRTFQNFFLAFGLSIVFVYLILAAQFESWIHPITILLSLPLTVPFALLSVLLTGGSLNMFTMLGILVLFGIVKKNAILQVDHANGLRAKGMERNAAIVQASRDRLRPILMTTIAFVAGMLPLVFSTGTGAATNRAIGNVIAGGQTLALGLTLVATPVFYSLFDDLARGWNRVRARFRKRRSAARRQAILDLSEEREPTGLGVG
jgi:HAE1 family hydrophobic/amphiphilic exporter-1